MGFFDGITDAIGLTNTDATKAASSAAKAAQLTPFNFFGPGGTYGGFGTYAPQTTSPDGTYAPAAGTAPTAPTSKSEFFDALRSGILLGAQTAPGGYSYDGFTAAQRPGQDIGFNLGNLEPLRQGFGDFAGQALQGAFNPQQTNSYLGGLQGNSGLANNALLSSAFGLYNQPSSDQYRQQTLDLLRQQAAPFEQRAFNANQQNLFGTGRLGTTGGGLQTEAFARGLGQADLARQLQAGQESRLASSQQDQLLSSAFSRFGDTSRLAADLNQGLFGREQQSALFPGQLEAQQLGLAGSALGGQSQLYNQGLSQFQAALNAAIARSNAASGVASNLTAQAGQGGPLAGLWGGLASGAGAGLAAGAFGGGGGAAAMAALFSDSRLKSNIVRAGRMFGLPAYRWSWNDIAKTVGAEDMPTRGVLAQDVRAVYPEAVGERNGYMTVDYGMLEALYGH